MKEWVDCYDCGGDGWVESDDWQDFDEWLPCRTCGAIGGWQVDVEEVEHER